MGKNITGPINWILFSFLWIFVSPLPAHAVSVVDCDLVKDYNIDWQDLEVFSRHWLDTCGDCNGADLNDSGTVNMTDFALFAPYWQTEINYAVAAPRCDLVKDYKIDIKDLGIIVDNWLLDCTTNDCNGSDLDNNGTVNMADFAFFAQHWNADCLDLGYLWGFIEQQWTNTMYDLTHVSTYATPDANYPRAVNPTTGKWIPLGMGWLSDLNRWGYVHWAGGYIPGSLWYMYQHTSDQTWKNYAQSWTKRLDYEQTRTKDHEAGFIVPRSFGLGYKITSDPNYKQVIINATDTLIDSRHNPLIGCIKSWNKVGNKPYTVIIDGMMVLDMVFWASKNGGEPAWYNVAVSHANKTMANNVRPNGSVWQAVDYNEVTGAVDLKWNKQGYNNNTTWSRGQAWGIEGFVIAYRETLDPNYLTTAKKIANYFIDHLPPDYVPYWDFNAPEHPEARQVRDTSAAAIAASGLLDLITFLSDYDPAKQKYQNAAVNILNSLASSTYLAEGTNSMGILLHGTANGNNTSELDTSLMYGDHFFIEALMRYEDLFY